MKYDDVMPVLTFLFGIFCMTMWYLEMFWTNLGNYDETKSSRQKLVGDQHPSILASLYRCRCHDLC